MVEAPRSELTYTSQVVVSLFLLNGQQPDRLSGFRLNKL